MAQQSFCSDTTFYYEWIDIDLMNKTNVQEQTDVTDTHVVDGDWLR